MKKDEIKAGNFYLVKPQDQLTGRGQDHEGFLRIVWAALDGTNRVVYCTHYSPIKFISQTGYTFSLPPEALQCWVPKFGEKAEFSDQRHEYFVTKIFMVYETGSRWPFKTMDDAFKFARPLKQSSDQQQVKPLITREEVQEMIDRSIARQVHGFGRIF